MASKKTINQKLDELQQGVDWFYSEEFELGQAEAKYKTLIEKTNELKTDLEELKNRIEVLDVDFSRAEA